MSIRSFPMEGRWYKGNLHAHSTVSDGRWTPERVASHYRENGYSFMAFSEHEIFTDFKELSTPSFLILPAVEYSCSRYEAASGKRLQTHHIHGILGTADMQETSSAAGLRHMEELEALEWEGAATAQRMTDRLRSSGHACIYNHPTWSRIEYDELMALEGCFALEIYNHGSELESHTGYSVHQWDALLRRGRRLFAVAADDNHNELEDSCGGWVCVKARELNHDAMIQGLLSGEYYSSNGPELYDLRVEDGVVHVACSPVNRIHFVASDYLNSGGSVWGSPGEDRLTEAAFRLRGDEAYVRVECTDALGRTAWSNPIFLK